MCPDGGQSRRCLAVPRLPVSKIYEHRQAVLGSRDVTKRAAISSHYFPPSDAKLIQTYGMDRYTGKEIAEAFAIAARNTTPSRGKRTIVSRESPDEPWQGLEKSPRKSAAQGWGTPISETRNALRNMRCLLEHHARSAFSNVTLGRNSCTAPDTCVPGKRADRGPVRGAVWAMRTRPSAW